MDSLKKSGRILIADDNRNVVNALMLFLPAEFAYVKAIHNPNLIIQELGQTDYDVVLLDMNFQASQMSGNEGLYWLNEIKSKFPRIEVIVFTAFGDIELAVKALKGGAADFVLKPWENEKLLASLHNACRLSCASKEIQQLKRKEKFLRSELNPEIEVLYRSEAMQKVMALVKKVAPTDANVLITGENGTGKELIAREIHKFSNRREGYFVLADLSAVSETLFESELFGHVKGAFTDAREDREGKFMLADHGTLFLDEIGNIPLHLQSKLLSVLQTRTVYPVGSDKGRLLDTRLVCATNKNPEELIKAGSFREDLLYRINTIRIHLPPLRDRKEDIPLLAERFLERYARKYHRTPVVPDEAFLDKLCRMNWPGNIREFQHAMEKIVVLSEGGKADPDLLWGSQEYVKEEEEPVRLEDMERRMILKALEHCGYNLSSAAKRLGISRPTLYDKMKKYGF